MTNRRTERLVEEWDKVTRGHAPTTRPQLSAGMNGRTGVLLAVAAVVIFVVLVPSHLMPSTPGGTPVPSASVAGGDAALADWWVDPGQLPIPSGAVTIKAFLQERECASRQSPAGRIVGPQIEYRADAVVVTFRVRAVGGECPSNPIFPITITLTEPIGNRSILDGGTGRDATINPTIAIEPAEDCGPLVGTEDAKVACMAFIAATLADRYGEFATVSVALDGATCAPDTCTTRNEIEARAWLVSAADRGGATYSWRCSYEGEVATCNLLASTRPSTAPSDGPPTPSPSAGAVDDAGTFGVGGLWAVRGTVLFISLDTGQSWRASTLPLRSGSDPGAWRLVVLDVGHAWLVQNGPGTTAPAGSDTDIDKYIVSRTTDGGTTWTTTNVPGNYPGTYPALAFADTEHGFLVAAASRLSLGGSTVLRSDDGGATWTAAGTKKWLDRLVAVSDLGTVWAGGAEQAGGSFDQSILSVSRDTGRTWEDLLLPGLAGRTEATCGCYLPGPPIFTNPTEGYVVVVNSFGNGANGTWLETTSDGGRTWVEQTFRPNIEASGAAELTADDWLMARVNPSGMDSSSDAGKTWLQVVDTGAFSGTAPIWIHALGDDAVVTLVQGSGTVLHLWLSTDGGTTFTDIGPR